MYELEASLQGLTQLRSLNLSNNALTGTLPSTWDFPDMKVLNLSANQLNGTVPEGAAPLCAVPLQFVQRFMGRYQQCRHTKW